MTEQDTSPSEPGHVPGTRKGEEMASEDGKEAGRHDTGASGADRPAGTRTARDATSINAEAEEPIDPQSPSIPPA